MVTSISLNCFVFHVCAGAWSAVGLLPNKMSDKFSNILLNPALDLEIRRVQLMFKKRRHRSNGFVATHVIHATSTLLSY